MKRMTLFLLLLALPFFIAAPFLGAQKEEVKPLQVPQQKGKQFDPASRGTGYVAPTPEQRRRLYAANKVRNGDHILRAATFLALPSKFDCRVKAPQPVGDQGPCGSCYLYSTVWYSLTCAAYWNGTGKPGGFLLAVQYGMDRPRDFGGCNGGWGAEVVDWACKHGWVAEYWTDLDGKKYNDYPAYEARSGSDRTRSGAKVWCKGWTWGFVSASGENGKWTIDEFKAAMNLYGYINVSLDAGGQFGSGTGTITSLGRSINHEIGACAYDDDESNPDGSKGTILLVNQWSTDWGVNGYRKITYKAALAGIVDPFWVSAGVAPVPPDPTPPDPPVPNLKPPFRLYIGVVTQLVQVGQPGGYDTLAQAKSAAQVIANQKDMLVPVHVYDSTPQFVTTVTPVGPGPVPGPVTITLTDAQVQDVLRQAGAITVTPTMTLQQLLDQLKERNIKLGR